MENPGFAEMAERCEISARKALREALEKLGILIEVRRGVSLKSALKKCFEVENPPVADKSVLDELALKIIKKYSGNHDKDERFGPRTDAGNETSKTTQQLAKGDAMPPDTTQPAVSVRNNSGGPPGGDDDDSDGDDDEGKLPVPKPSSAQKSSRFTVPSIIDDNPSHGISMFTKMYQSEKDRFDGDPDSSFLVFRATLLMNALASKVDSEEAASVFHKTLRGNALKT